MKIKKLFSAITAALCCSGIISYFPANQEYVTAVTLVSDDFETNYDGWHGSTDTVKLSADSFAGYNGSRGMTVSDRTNPTDGASSSKGFYLEGGVNYHYSIQVISETSETFRFTLTYIDSETDKEETVLLSSEECDSGKWSELSADYMAPENSYEFRLTISTDSTNDFTFDEVYVTSKENLNTVYAASAEKGLKDEFADYFRVGNILNGSTVANSAITANILKDYNSIECENEMKPDATLVQSQCNGTNVGVSLNNAAAIIDFCVNNNIAMRGHAFVWHSQTPSWFFKENYNANGAWVSSSVMDQRLESYIKNMFNAIETQYPSLNLYAYDVVNEAVSDDSNRTANYGGAREAGDNNVTGGTSAWVSVYGDNSFVEKAFTYARKYAPEGCDLYYNDYNEYWDHKRDCIYNMCKDLYEKGLLDGVGMQSHVPANATGFAGTDSYITAMKKYLSIGCDVQITELDISTENGKYTLQEQADKYKSIFQAAMDWNKNPASSGRVTAVCIWGPNDANTWIKSENAPLLYDVNNQPKLAYTTLTNIIPESEWGDGSNYNEKIEPNEYGWYFYDTFEGNTFNWSGRGSADIMTSGRTAYVGSEALLIQNRTEAWNGAQKKLNTAAFVPGSIYSFSVNAIYFDGDSTEKFYMKLQYTDSNGNTCYSTISEATAIQSEWVQLANKNYQIPADASNMYIYVETADSANNFYIDEAIGAVEGTSIMGAGSKEIILGDINSDGIINAFDLIIAKRGYTNGFSSKSSQICADVNQNGIFDENDISLIEDFLLCKITEFPVEEKITDTAAMEQLFSNINLTSSYKKSGENNPLYTQRFGADPGVMEYNGRVYVYSTNDIIEYDNGGSVIENTYGQINQINCISSDDMVNWTDHGAIQVAGSSGAASWAINSWAPCAAHKTINGKEKFFLYFCNGGNGVSVLTADSPTGPWTDPLGKGLITRSTPNCSNVTWLFDPAVLVDDDGTGYLYFGGGVPDGKTENPGTARVVKLGNDMISLAGDPQTIDVPYLFEDSGINKIGNKYYYTYCSNWNTTGNSYGMSSGAIQYMISDSPMGPFTYGGELFKNQGNFFSLYGNNHHSIVELNSELYLFYHARAVEAAMGITGNYRSPQVNKITMNGISFNSVIGDMKGIPQLKSLNPYEKVQAETISRQAGVNVRGTGDTIITDIQSGDWISVFGADFSKGSKSLTICASSQKEAIVKICVGNETGKAIGYAVIPNSDGKFTEITVPVNNISGNQDIYFIFSDTIELDWWQFT